MKINLLLNPANRTWIIQKIAENLTAELVRQGVAASITDNPNAAADLVHHMSWAFANVRTDRPSTMFITHLDDPYKIAQVLSTLAKSVDVGICMSSDTMRLLKSRGCNAGSLYYISPAHDGAIVPRQLRIGITSRTYPDGRKRESLLAEVADRMDLSAFHFQIFGNGWESIVPVLRSAGARVDHAVETDDFRADYNRLKNAIPDFDYYLYMGMDEGSLGTLDALAAGVPTIITPQGFHVDLPGGITHPVVTSGDLLQVLGRLSAERFARIQSVEPLTWENYARKHVALWAAVLAGGQLPPLQSAPVRPAEEGLAVQLLQRHVLRRHATNPQRIAAAMSHLRLLGPLRRVIDRIRLKR